MNRFRLLSAVCLIAVLVSAASLYGLRQAQSFDARGRPNPFPEPVRGAGSLLLGVNAALDQYDDAELESRLTQLNAANVGYVRMEFRWSGIEPARGKLDWRLSDRVFDALEKHSLRVLPVLLATPAWARGPSGSDADPAVDSSPPASADDFARFCRAFAARYNQRAVLGYQIWDEPNLSSGWGNNLISPGQYLKLLWAAGDAIRAEAGPSAKIVLAGLAPTTESSEVNLAPQLFLQRLYQLGGHDAFDIVAAKPFGFDFAALDRRVAPDVLNLSNLILMREVMAAHGEAGKAIWATQFGWNALPSGWAGEKSIWGQVTEDQQAQFTRDAVRRAADEWPWVGAMFLDRLEPRRRASAESAARDPAWGFALLDQASQPRPVFQALKDAAADAAQAPRAQQVAVCDISPRSLALAPGARIPAEAKADSIAAQPAIPSDCYQPNANAQFTPGWRFSERGADTPRDDGAQVTIHFNGDALALIVRRAGIEYRAYSFVAVDGQPANRLPREPRGAYLVMNSADYVPRVETVLVADRLGPGPHTAVVKLDGGWNLWGLVGWTSRASGPERDYAAVTAGLAAAALAGLLGLLAAARPARWPLAVAGLRQRLFRWRWAMPASLLAALAVWGTAALTWVQDAATAYRNTGVGAPVVVSALTSAVAIWSPAYVASLAALAVLLVLVLLRLDMGLMLVAFFVPFYLLPQRLFAYSFSMVELVALMSFVSWLVSLWPRRATLFTRVRTARMTWFDIAVAGLVLIALASAAFAAERRVEAFRELRVVILEPALIYLILRTSSFTTAQRWAVIDGLVAGAAAVAVVGLVNYARGDVIAAEFGLPRIKSVFGSPNNDALFLGRVIPLALAVALARFSSPGAITQRRWLAYAGALAPMALALVLSQSRGALLLGAPVAIAAVCWTAGGRWRWLSAAIATLLVVAFGVLLSGAAAPYLEGTRYANALDLTRGTGFFRVNLWQSALAMWRDHPVLGVGPDNFLYAYRSFYILPVAWKEPNLSHPHNIVLDFATRLGGLGLAAGILLIAGAVKLTLGGLRRPITIRPLAIGAAGMLGAMLAHGLVDHSFFLIELAYPFMLIFGLLAQPRYSDGEPALDPVWQGI